VTQDRYEDIELGRNVTEAATRGAQARATAVLSLRVTAAELAEIEAVGRASGKSVSQVVRDSVREHLYHERFGPCVTISFLDSTFTQGAGLRETTRASAPSHNWDAIAV
jgi:hypothetical protein